MVVVRGVFWKPGPEREGISWNVLVESQLVKRACLGWSQGPHWGLGCLLPLRRDVRAEARPGGMASGQGWVERHWRPVCRHGEWALEASVGTGVGRGDQCRHGEWAGCPCAHFPEYSCLVLLCFPLKHRCCSGRVNWTFTEHLLSQIQHQM